MLLAVAHVDNTMWILSRNDCWYNFHRNRFPIFKASVSKRSPNGDNTIIITTPLTKFATISHTFLGYLLLHGWVKSFELFWFKQWKMPAVVGSIVVVGALTCCASLHSMSDLKVAQMNE